MFACDTDLHHHLQDKPLCCAEPQANKPWALDAQRMHGTHKLLLPLVFCLERIVFSEASPVCGCRERQ